jgi:hypothetical protein
MKPQDSRGFSALQENIRALDPQRQTQKWMNNRPQMCWKCQQNKRVFGGSIKMFGNLSRFICVDCVRTKQAELANAKQELK